MAETPEVEEQELVVTTLNLAPGGVILTLADLTYIEKSGGTPADYK